MRGPFKPDRPVVCLVGAVFAPVGAVLTAVGIVAGSALKKYGEQADLGSAIRMITGTFLGFGVLFLLLGLVFLGYTRYRVRRQKQAFENGECITADFAGMEQIVNITVNGRHPYRARLRGRDLYGGIRDYYSRRLTQDLSAQLSGRQIPVYIDRSDPENYYVDLQSVLSDP